MLIRVAVLLLTAHYAAAEGKLSSLRFPIVSPNRIVNVNATCNATSLNINITMAKPFKGLLSAKDFSQECRSVGDTFMVVVGILQNTISINIPASGCGVRMSANSTDKSMYYSVTLVVQQDKYLRQITDQERAVRCRLLDGALSLKSEPMFEALKTEVNQAEAKEYRTGRMRSGWKGSQTNDKILPHTDDVSELLDKELENVLGAARAWMEIIPAEGQVNSGTVQVGEATMLSVKSTLPAGIGWRVVDCTAHDGIGEVSQRLLDEMGCPIDETILPALTVTEPKMMGKKSESITVMRHQEAIASFSAFKFPDRDRLHVTCGLQLCRGRCQTIYCRKFNDSSSRGARKLAKGEQGEVLDRLEVFNSVEVLAPGIELEDLRNPDLNSGDSNKKFATLHIPGDRAFCVSPNKMAIAFCILGVVFIVAVVVALCSLMRARRTGNRMPYYSRSLFSSSSGGSGYGGSKLLLHESPTMGQTRHWRIL